MLLKKIHIMLFFLVFTGSFCFSQNTDSLKNELAKANHDTTRCNLLRQLVESEPDDIIWPQYNNQLKSIAEKNLNTLKKGDPGYRFFLRALADAYDNLGYLADLEDDLVKSRKYYEKSLGLFRQLNEKNSEASVLTGLGRIFQRQGKTEKSLQYYTDALGIYKVTKNKKGTGEAFHYIGTISKHQGNIPKALECYIESLKISESLGDENGKATTMNNLASIYSMQGEFAKAKEEYEKCYRIYEKTGNTKGLASALNNIGMIYDKLKQPDKAMQYYKRSIEKNSSIKNRQGVATCLNNIGFIFSDRGELDSALVYLNQTLQIDQENNDIEDIASTEMSIANIMLRKNKVDEAIRLGEKSMKTSRDLGFPLSIRNAADVLARAYAKKSNYKKAHEMQVLFKQMHDSINNENNRRASIRKSFQYMYDKKAAADSVKKAEDRKIFDAQIRQEKIQRITLYGVISITAIFSVFMYNRFRVTRKQKAIIEQQKEIVEEKQKEIMDSIRYAKRIQRSLLPQEKAIEKMLSRLKS